MTPFFPLRRYHFRWPLMIAVAAVLGGVLLYEAYNVRIETDILASLPRHDPVLADAYRVIRHLPVQDRLIIDCQIRGGSRDTLVAGAELIEAGLKKSGLFRQVGMEQMQTLMPELVAHIVDHLPLLFNGPQFEAEIAPLLAPAVDGIRARSPTRGRGKVMIRRKAMPIVVRRIAIRISRRAAFSLSRAAR